jgi:uncharacterized repeat protein (TIGR02543 family)
MKRFITMALLGLGFGSGAWAAPQQVYVNYGVVTNIPQVDATSFVNQGTIGFNTVTVNVDYNDGDAPADNDEYYSSIPFSTKDTLYYTNTPSGLLQGTNAFNFLTITSDTVTSASMFENDGVITAFDLQAVADTFTPTQGATPLAVPAGSLPVASVVNVLATNIINDGTISVGNAGLLKLTGNNVNNANGVLVAGALNTGGGNGVNSDPLDTTGGGNNVPDFGGGAFFVDPPGVYDLFWGVTATTSNLLALDQLDLPDTTAVNVSTRQGGTIGLSFPISVNPSWTVSVSRFDLDVSNTSWNIVFVNTNFMDINGQQDTNITATIGFTTELFSVNGGPFDEEPVVQFAQPVFDVITRQVVTNAAYLVDFGGVLNEAVQAESINAASEDDFNRPQAFYVTTTTPAQWLDAAPGNAVYDPNVIYENNVFMNKDVPYVVAEYGALIGRNPAQLDGSFTLDTTIFGSIASDLDVILPDPTNEPGRIELTANQLNLSNSRLRAEGMMIVNATNFTGGTAGSDWGEINSQLGQASGSLVVSNFYPTNFQRLRGGIFAYMASWVNIATNNPFGGTLTNTFHYHVLVVDQALGGHFPSTIRNLNFTGTNSINVYDSLRAIDSVHFNTSNLTFNANTVFTQNAGNLTMTNFPNLKYFLNNSNASLSVDSILDMGFDVTTLPTPPAGRAYTVSNISNFGQITATAPLFQSQSFENDGTITANNNGSLLIEAASLGLGQALPNTNTLLAGQNVTLSAISIQASNSQIFAGGVGGTNVGLLTLQSTATGQITDHVSSLPGTNSPLMNFWQVTDGFSLPIKPATGDLFGTEITTIATGFTAALHTWAGVDMGPVAAGFSDNVVIGHLKLSRQSTNALLHFTGAGVQNGMYVDYLELDPNSLFFTGTDFRDGLVIDPNLTIYFAAANVNPTKLTNAFPNRLVWVTNFVGPNSTVAVPYFDSTNVCLMNASVATSPDIAFFPPTPNADNQPYVLNNPTNRSIFTNCPTDIALLRDLSDAALLQEFNFEASTGTNVNLIISSVGQGTVSPSLKRSQVAMGKKYTLTATPADGWVFSGWTANGLSGEMDTSARTLKFTLQNDLVLTANFTAKAYTLAKGSYYGLFTNRVPKSDNSGWFTFTLGQSGALSGRFLLEGVNYAFSSTFPATGPAQVVAKHGSQSLTATLNLDLTDPDGQVTGDVSDGVWDSPLLGNVAPNWTRKNSSPFAGQYTMVVSSPNTNTVPVGDSYGSLNVSKQGVLSVAGKLADGNVFNQSVPVSTNGLWPFYTYVAKGNDVLLGWVAMQQNDLAAETNIFWGKAASLKDPYYPDGFTNAFDLTASSYAVPGKGATTLSLTSPVLTLTGGGLTEALSNSITYKGKQVYAGSNLTLSINPALGSFTGSFENPADGASLKLNGVVLQNQESAFGFFLGTNNESGTVFLQSQ